MSEREPEIQFDERTLEQIEDLENWLGKAHATSVIEAAISSAWHVENARRQERIGAPWVVRPGPHHFSNQDAAMLWLEQQGARPVSPGTWATFDQDGMQEVWDLEPLWFEDQAA